MAASPPFMAAAAFLTLVVVLFRAPAPAIAVGEEAAALLAFRRASVADDPDGALASWVLGAGGATPPRRARGTACRARRRPTAASPPSTSAA